MIFADSIENIPFDWSGQFGCVSHNGTILWNKDWSSNQLFFDGTWAIFPRMYGPVVDKGFNQPMDDLHHKKDSSNVKSNFKYDQGDYLLDRNSIGLDYKTNSRKANAKTDQNRPKSRKAKAETDQIDQEAEKP